MIVDKLKQILKFSFIVLFFAVLSFNKLTNYCFAEVEDLVDYFDYSGFSEEEIKEEVKLLYKYAKKTYTDGDFETAKLLFYQILKLEPDHSGANKYIDILIPKKLGEIKQSEIKEERKISEIKNELEFQRSDRVLKSAKEQIDFIEIERKDREQMLREKLSQLENEATLMQKIKIEEENAKKKENMVIINEKLEHSTESILSQEKQKEEVFRINQASEELVRKEEERLKEIIGRELARVEEEQARLVKEREIRAIQENNKKIEEQYKEELEAKKREIFQSDESQLSSKRDDKDDIGLRRQELLSKAGTVKEEQVETEAKEKKDKKVEKRIEGEQLTTLDKHQQNTLIASKKSKKAHIKALYKEGIYAYRNGGYDLALKAFNKILELDFSQIKAADYVHIYIPEAEKDSRVKDR